MRIGIAELAVIFIVALFVIGPDKLPAYARKLGEALAQFKKYSDEATRDIKESIVEPLEQAQKPLREAVEPLESIDRAVRGNVKDMRDSLQGIGKTKPSAPEAPPPEPPPEAAPSPEPSEESAPSTEPTPKEENQ